MIRSCFLGERCYNNTDYKPKGVTSMFHVLAGSGTGGGFDPSLIIMIVVMIAMVYFMMIRPENKRKKEAEATRESIKNGQREYQVLEEDINLQSKLIIL